jgi:hypothetical protein
MANQRFHSRIVEGRVLADHDPRPGAPLADLGIACTHIEGRLPGTRLAFWSRPVAACRHTTGYLLPLQPGSSTQGCQKLLPTNSRSHDRLETR